MLLFSRVLCNLDRILRVMSFKLAATLTVPLNRKKKNDWNLYTILSETSQAILIQLCKSVLLDPTWEIGKFLFREVDVDVIHATVSSKEAK